MDTNIFDPVTLTLDFDLFLKTLTLFITFEQWVLELWYLIWVFYYTNNVDLVTLSPEFDLFIENINLANNLWTVNARALIFHMNIPCGKNFPYVQTCWPLNNIWIVSAWALLFYTSISSNRTFLWQDHSTGIKIFILVICAISGIGHYRWHLRFTNTSCLHMGSS